MCALIHFLYVFIYLGQYIRYCITGYLHDVQIFRNVPMSRENYVGLFLRLDCGF